MKERHYEHQGTIIPGKTPFGPTIVMVGFALLPLWLTILLFIFFVASGKLVL